MPAPTDIFIGIGANLPSPVHGPPLATCRAVPAALVAAGLHVVSCSRWYRSRPVPPSDQPSYVNGVVRVATSLAPAAMLTVLHRIEADFGRVREARNAARVLDLDLIAHGDRVIDAGENLIVPHPRMHERAFVLGPLAELAPEWRHPLLGLDVAALLASLPADAVAVPIAPALV